MVAGCLCDASHGIFAAASLLGHAVESDQEELVNHYCVWKLQCLSAIRDSVQGMKRSSNGLTVSSTRSIQ